MDYDAVRSNVFVSCLVAYSEGQVKNPISLAISFLMAYNKSAGSLHPKEDVLEHADQILGLIQSFFGWSQVALLVTLRAELDSERALGGSLDLLDVVIAYVGVLTATMYPNALAKAVVAFERTYRNPPLEDYPVICALNSAQHALRKYTGDSTAVLIGSVAVGVILMTHTFDIKSLQTELIMEVTAAKSANSDLRLGVAQSTLSWLSANVAGH
jgi:hypothetical protein